MAKKTLTYVYKSNYATVVFNVEGEDDWTEEQFDSASEFDIADYATNPSDYYLDDVYNTEDPTPFIVARMADQND